METFCTIKKIPKEGEISYHEDDPVRDETVFEFSSKVPILQKVEEIQYKAARIITGAWQSSRKRELYKILGWESPNQPRILRKLTILLATLINKYLSHLFEIIKSDIYSNDSRLGGRLLLKEIHCKKNAVSQRISTLYNQRLEFHRFEQQRIEN